VLLQLVDRVGSIAGMRHSEGRCTTAAVERVVFHTASHVGDILTVRAQVVDVGRTSMAVVVTIDAERVEDRQLRRIVTGYLRLVAVDEAGRPRPVPDVVPETDEEREAQAAARARRDPR
jgi:acyl-CoA hydrolase